MIGKLTEDAAKGGKGPIKILQTSNPLSESSATATTVASAKSSKPEYNPEYDIEKLQEEKEKEIKELLNQLESYKGKIEGMQATIERG